MENIFIDKDLIEIEMENWINENPYADSFELAEHFFAFGQKYCLEKIKNFLKEEYNLELY